MVNRIINDIDFDGQDDYEGKYNDDDVLQVNEEKMALLIGANDVAYHMLKYARPFVRKICGFDEEILDEMQDAVDQMMYITANKNESGVSYWDVEKDISQAVTQFLQFYEELKGVDLDADKKGDSE